MITIFLNNTTCRIQGPNRETNLIYKGMKIKNPNAFFLRKYMPRGWDGCKEYLTSHGTCKAGLFPWVLDICKKENIQVAVNDYRESIEVISKIEIPRKMANGFIPFDHQYLGVRSIVENNIGGILYPRGVLFFATNSGKTLTSALLHLSLHKARTLFFVNSTELHTQMLRELEEFLPGKVGYVCSKKGIKLREFNICMVKTFLNRYSSIRGEVNTHNCVIVDECDLSDNATFKELFRKLPSIPVVVGLSGSVFVSTLKKDLMKKLNITEKFGSLLYKVTNAELIEKGISSKVKVRFIKGNTKDLTGLSYREAYVKGIVKNKKRNLKVVSRILKYQAKGFKYFLILCKEMEHVEVLTELIKENVKGLSVEWAHHDRHPTARRKAIDGFEKGKINILVGSMILKRGKNFPLMQYLLNAAGGKSPENTLQILGRSTRKHGSKKFTVHEDFWDIGDYLKTHSRRRFLTYKNEKIEVTNKYY